jgi:hypothetical protein
MGQRLDQKTSGPFEQPTNQNTICTAASMRHMKGSKDRDAQPFPAQPTSASPHKPSIPGLCEIICYTLLLYWTEYASQLSL